MAQDDDTPLVVYLFRGLLIVLEFVVGIFGILIALYIRYVLEPVFQHLQDSVKQITLSTILFGWIPRILACYGFLGVIGVQTLILAYIVAGATSGSLSGLGALEISGIIVGSLIIAGFGVLIVRRRFEFFKNYKYSLTDYVKEGLYSHLDVLVSLVALFTCICLVRYRQLSKIGNSEGASERWRELVMYEFGMTFLDVLILPFLAIIFVFHWRWAHFQEQCKFVTEDEELKVKYITIQEAFNCIIDLPFLALGLVVICSIYRSVRLVRKLREAPITDLRRICYEEFIDLLLDVPFAFMTLLLVFFPWRMVFFFYDISRASLQFPLEPWTYRYVLMTQLLLGFFDILAVFCFPFVFITMYRLNQLIARVRLETEGFFAQTHENYGTVDAAMSKKFDAHLIVIMTLVQIIADIPSLICVVIVTGLLYRAPSMFQGAYAENGTFDVDKLLGSARKQIKEILIDLIPIILGIFSFLFLWRLPSFIWGLRQLDNAPKRRSLAILTFFVGFIDVVGILLGTVILATWYRVDSFNTAISEGKIPFFTSPLVFEEKDGLNTIVFEVESSERATLIHLLVFQTIFEIFIDLLHLILASVVMMTVWRGPNLISRLWNPTKTISNDIRNRRASNDIPVGQKDRGGLIPSDEGTDKPILESNREDFDPSKSSINSGLEDSKLPIMHSHVSKLQVYTRREIVRQEFMEWLLDLPAVLVMLILLAIPIVCLTLLYTFSDKLLSGLENQAPGSFAIVVFSIFVIIPVRQVLLFRDIFYFSSGLQAEHVRFSIFEAFGLYFLDFPAVFSAFVIFITRYRVPRLQRRLQEKNSGLTLPYGSESRSSAHFILMHEFFEILCDVPFIALGTFVYATLWRARALHRDLFSDPALDASTRRWKAAEHFMDLLIDIPFIILFFFVTCTIYNSYSLWKEVFNADPINLRRKIIFDYFTNFLLDFPSAIVGVFCIFSVYRGVSLIRDLVYYAKDAKERRRAAWENFFMLLLDIPAIPSMLVLSLTQYRLPKLRKSLLDTLNFREQGDERPPTAENTSLIWLVFALPFDVKQPRLLMPVKAISQFGSVLIDSFFAALLVSVIITGWKARSLRTKWNEHKANGAPNDITYFMDGYRLIIFTEFLNLILEIPYMVVFVIDILSIIRTIPTLRDVCVYVQNDDQFYDAILENFALIFLDILAIPMYLVVIVTYYRSSLVHQAFKDSNTGLFVPFNGEIRYKRLEAPVFVISQFFGIIFDVPFVFMALLCFASVYRGYFLYQKYKEGKLSIKDGLHRPMIFMEFVDLVFDIPFLLPGLVALISWRSSEIRTIMKSASLTAGEKRIAVLMQFLLLFLDLLEIFVCCFLVIAFWRIPTLYFSLRNKPLHKTVTTLVGLIFLDILSVLMLFVVLIGIQRIFVFYSESQKLIAQFAKYSSEKKSFKGDQKQDLEQQQRKIEQSVPSAPKSETAEVAPPPYEGEFEPAGEVPLVDVEESRIAEPSMQGEPEPKDVYAVVGEPPALEAEIRLDIEPKEEKHVQKAADGSMEFDQLMSRTISHFENWDGHGAPLSLTWLYVLIKQEAWLSIILSYKIFFFVFRILGYALTPFYYLIKKRVLSSQEYQKNNISPEGFPMKPYWSSFLFEVPEKLFKYCPEPNQFETNDKFFAIMALSIPPWLLNEFTVILLYPQIAMMRVCSLFQLTPELAPLSFLYTGNLEEAIEQGNFEDSVAAQFHSLTSNFWDVIVALIQFVLFPGILALEVLFVGLPFTLFFLWKGEFVSPDLWIIVTQAVFLLPAGAALQLAYRHAARTNLRFRPHIMAWTILLTVFSTFIGRGVLLLLYGSILAYGTKYCHAISRWQPRCMFRPIAELLLLCVTSLWAFWPSIFPIYLDKLAYLGLTIPIGAVLLYFAVRIVRKTWRNARAQN